jgi:hypothetical protein
MKGKSSFHISKYNEVSQFNSEFKRIKLKHVQALSSERYRGAITEVSKEKATRTNTKGSEAISQNNGTNGASLCDMCLGTDY